MWSKKFLAKLIIYFDYLEQQNNLVNIYHYIVNSKLSVQL